MTELGSRAPHQTAEELQAEALVARAEAQYERRFVEGEQVARDEGLREELVAVRRELNELSDAGSNVRRRSAYAAGLAALLLEGLESASAKTALQTAVKLDPGRAGAWNALGHCYWADGALRLAWNCFERGLDAEPGNKEGLRQRSVLRRHMLSVVPQQSEDTHDGKKAPAAESSASISDAKTAVQRDPSDGYSWYCKCCGCFVPLPGRFIGIMAPELLRTRVF
mmetsp:Transcript_18546/g.33055  ORF Transcript_18546/g.33055 Transcript_18546/m.33055 type:complete len:224 (-) Transcript_18546:30-701(-)